MGVLCEVLVLDTKYLVLTVSRLYFKGTVKYYGLSHILLNFSFLNFLGTTLAVLKNLHLVVGIVSLIIRVLGIGAVVQVALKGQQENISLGSFQLLIHLQKKTWPLMKILCLLL